MERTALDAILRAILLVVLITPSIAQTPVVRATDVRPAPGGASGAFVAEVDGQLRLFKASEGGSRDPLLRMANGNVEAEYLVSRLFERAGFQTPRVRLVRLEGRSGLYSMADWVPDHLDGRRVIKDWRRSAALPDPRTYTDFNQFLQDYTGRFDGRQLRLMQVLDLVVGNGDRNTSNFFLVEGADGRLRPVPIDHDRALVGAAMKPDTHLPVAEHGVHRNFVPRYSGESTFGYHSRQAGTAAPIMNGNEIYENHVMASRGAQDYQEAVRDVRHLLSDSSIDELLRELPDDVPAARRQEIRDTLRWRRDHVDEAVRTLVDAPAGSTRASRLGARLRDQHRPTTSAAEQFLSRLLPEPGPVAPDVLRTRLDDAYLSLRERGAPVDEARLVMENAIESMKRLGHDVDIPSDWSRSRIPHLEESRGGGRVSADSLGKALRTEIQDRVARVRSVFSGERAATRARMQDLGRRYQSLDHMLKMVREDAARPEITPGELERARSREARLTGLQERVVDEYLARGRRVGERGRSDHQEARAEAVLKRLERGGPVEDGGAALAPRSIAAAETAGSRALGAVRQDIKGGGLVTSVAIAGVSEMVTRVTSGEDLAGAARATAGSLTTAEFLLGDLAAGTAGAALGSMVVLPSLGTSVFAQQLGRSLPGLTGAFLAARLGANAVTLIKQDRFTVGNWLGSVDWLSTGAQIVGSSVGASLANAAIQAKWLPALRLGPVALTPILAGIGAAVLMNHLVNVVRGPAATTAPAPRSPAVAAEASLTSSSSAADPEPFPGAILETDDLRVATE